MSRTLLRFLWLLAVTTLLAVFLYGCSSTGQFQNRLVCTVAGDKALVVSQYGQLGMSTELATTDSAIVCSKVQVAK